jgi:uncharacterized membrane protein
MHTKKLYLLMAPLILLTACGEETVTSPQAAPPDVLQAKQEASSYDVIALDGRWTQTTGINDAGIVVGRKLVGREFVDVRSEDEEWQAALWIDGVATTLGISHSTFVGITNQGVGLGLEKDEEYTPRQGFLYRGGLVTPITGVHPGTWPIGDAQYLTGSLDDDYIWPKDINESETVIARGRAIVDGVRWYYAFSWQEGSGITYIEGGLPVGMNNHGQIVGYATDTYDPVVWAAGSYHEPQVLTGLRDHFPGYEIELFAINDSGQILGIACNRDDYYYDDQGNPAERVRLCSYGIPVTTDRRGFVLDGGTVVELPLPRHSDLWFLQDLNGGGRVVGTVYKREGSETNYVPLLWTVNTTGATVQELPRGGHTHAVAVALNELNEVAGHANPWEALLWKPAANGGGDDGGDDGGDCKPHPKTGQCR